jgi:phage terminase large subunit-like protein
MQDKNSYLGNQNLKRSGVSIGWNAENIQEYVKCSQDPVYFIKNYIKIVNIDKGLVPFEIWPFQEQMVRTAVDNRFVICKMPRQVGKTTTVAALLLWYVLFTENYKIAILANKEKQSREILSRIQLAFEHLPRWLQQGVVQWNRGNIELENGSKILASSTSSTAIRGDSFNLIYLDEFAFVPNNIQDEFFASVYPTISSGQSSKILITSTPNGMNMFYKLWTDSEQGRNRYERVSVHWSDVPGRTPKWREETISNTSERQFSQEFECEFLGSSNTLIDGKVLQRLTYITPIHTSNNVDIYEHPQKGHRYVITVDTSRGVDIDYSACVVFDVTKIPYNIVAKFKANDISPLVYPNIVAQLGYLYNEAFVLVETNDIGQQVVDILQQDLEYPAVMVTQTKGRAGQRLSAGFGGKNRPQYGVKTTKQVKRIGCGNFKSLVENDKLIINDYDLLYEMARFIENKASYEAEEGEHDDLVMCCVLFGWLSNQPFFKDLTETDVRNILVEGSNALMDEDMTPFGWQDDGHGDEEGFSFGDPFYDMDVGPHRQSF